MIAFLTTFAIVLQALVGCCPHKTPPVETVQRLDAGHPGGEGMPHEPPLEDGHECPLENCQWTAAGDRVEVPQGQSIPLSFIIFTDTNSLWHDPLVPRLASDSETRHRFALPVRLHLANCVLLI